MSSGKAADGKAPHEKAAPEEKAAPDAKATPAAGAAPEPPRARKAFVLTVSDGVAEGSRRDESGAALEARLTDLGFDVERGAVADDVDTIEEAFRVAAGPFELVVSTGGTGLGPRDVTPEALTRVAEYIVPGFGELMRAEGRASTIFAALSRSTAGVTREAEARPRALLIAVPGSPRAALESLEPVVPLLDHALATIRGQTAQHPVDTKPDTKADTKAGAKRGEGDRTSR